MQLESTLPHAKAAKGAKEWAFWWCGDLALKSVLPPRTSPSKYIFFVASFAALA